LAGRKSGSSDFAPKRWRILTGCNIADRMLDGAMLEEFCLGGTCSRVSRSEAPSSGGSWFEDFSFRGSIPERFSSDEPIPCNVASCLDNARQDDDICCMLRV
jgi:hypothetical protein